MKELQLISIVAILGMSLSIGGILNASATGGAGQIAELVLSHLNDAKTYLNEGDVESALQELQTSIDELNDIYEADQEK